MTDLLVCRGTGGKAKGMSFTDYFRLFPHDKAPEAWEAATIATISGESVAFPDPTSPYDVTIVAPYSELLNGSDAVFIARDCIPIGTMRGLLASAEQAGLAPPTKAAPAPLLLTGPSPRRERGEHEAKTYRLELRAAPVMESYVDVEAASPEAAIYRFENNPGRWHSDAMEIVGNIWDWDNLGPGDWTVTSCVPKDD